MKRKTLHGAAIRGLHTNPKSSSFEGMFGRMFRSIPQAIHTPSEHGKLAEKMVAGAEIIQTPEDEIDNEIEQNL